jgi:GT2 family glycosyltransferase
LVIIELLRIFKFINKNKRGYLFFGRWFNYNEIAYPDWISGTFFMFSRKILNIFPEEKLPETFWMYFEDMEWCWLIRKAGYKIAFVPEGRVLHYCGGGKTYPEKTRKMMDENFRKFYYLYYGKTYLTILLFLIKILNWSQWRKWIKYFKKCYYSAGY